MPENLGVHVQLTSDSNNFTEAMQKAYRELKEFGNEIQPLPNSAMCDIINSYIYTAGYENILKTAVVKDDIFQKFT